MLIDRSMLQNAALVVAHPDDEILWFSSVLADVGRIIFCYLEDRNNSEMTEGRKRVLETYPFEKVTSLGLPEAGVLDRVNWKKPKPVSEGLEIVGRKKKEYRRNFSALQGALRRELADTPLVITHNPWGEYGHAEHVQVYRAVQSLSQELGYETWVSNYCSNRSSRLMLSCISGYTSEYVTWKVNRQLAEELRDRYLEQGCWTWRPEYRWFNEESFVCDRELSRPAGPRGHLFPLNFIKLPRRRTTVRSFLRGLRERLPF